MRLSCIVTRILTQTVANVLRNEPTDRAASCREVGLSAEGQRIGAVVRSDDWLGFEPCAVAPGTGVHTVTHKRELGADDRGC